MTYKELNNKIKPDHMWLTYDKNKHDGLISIWGIEHLIIGYIRPKHCGKWSCIYDYGIPNNDKQYIDDFVWTKPDQRKIPLKNEK